MSNSLLSKVYVAVVSNGHAVLLFGLFFLLSGQQSFCQVTIGLGVAAQKSALLELKEYEPDSDNTTSKKGVLIPRVKLKSRVSLSPMIDDSDLTNSEKQNNTGLLVFHVGGNDVSAGMKIWNGEAWNDLNNNNIEVNNGLSINSDTIQLGGSLSKATKITADQKGHNIEFNTTEDDTNVLITGTAKLGINTSIPEETVDINGTLAVRSIPVLETGRFTDIGIDSEGVINKKNKSFTAYSKYLGFSPMAAVHKDTIPLTLESGYIYIIEGTAIGACYGVAINFKITYGGTNFLGATLQATNTQPSRTTIYPAVSFQASESSKFFGKSLESLAGAGCGGTKIGHTLTVLNKNQLVVEFYDEEEYYEYAGMFGITNLVQMKTY